LAHDHLRRLMLLSAFLFALAPSISMAGAADRHVLKIPRRTQLTPVQRLNRAGVDAIKKHDYPQAESLFYKAYLYDPADPFTLNNLGYVSELEGDLDRAEKFYGLAAEQASNASIDLSNAKHLEGKPMRDALVNLKDAPMRVNQTNVTAMRLLAQNRGFEAIALLKNILPLDPRNPFTLNNLGVASESLGDYTGALRYYLSAASLNSAEPAAITLDRSWRGKSVSEMAAASARRLERRIHNTSSTETRAIMLTIQGVFAANENDWKTARRDFLSAYSLDPSSAFTLNNRGYVAEREGDLETAQYFYGKAQRAEGAASSVGFATRLAAEGQSLGEVASGSNGKVDDALEIYSQQRRKQTGPVELTPRGSGAANAPEPKSGTTPAMPATTPTPETQQQQTQPQF
jgi:Flp pilus assembly protein TadD